MLSCRSKSPKITHSLKLRSPTSARISRLSRFERSISTLARAVEVAAQRFAPFPVGRREFAVSRGLKIDAPRVAKRFQQVVERFRQIGAGPTLVISNQAFVVWQDSRKLGAVGLATKVSSALSVAAEVVHRVPQRPKGRCA